MGLNESYSAIRGQLLLMNPLPDDSQAYSSIIQEERQQNLGARRKTIEASAMVVQKDEPVALAVRHKSGPSSRPNSSKRKALHCSYCDRDIIIQERHAGSYMVFHLDIRSIQQPKTIISSPVTTINLQ